MFQARRKVTNPEDLLFTGVASGDAPTKIPASAHRLTPDTDKPTRRTPTGDSEMEKPNRRLPTVDSDVEKPNRKLPSGDSEVEKPGRRGPPTEKKPDMVLMPPPKSMPTKGRPNSGSYTQLPKYVVYSSITPHNGV